MKRTLIFLGLGFTIGLISWGLFAAGFFSGLENFFEDLLFSSKPISDKLIIVTIDDESINLIGQWPWPRAVYARALENMEKSKPAAVGIDVVFSEPSRFGSTDDNVLGNALRNISYPVILPIQGITLVLGNKLPVANTVLKPLPVFLENKNVTLGHVNLISDRDGVTRRFPPIIGVEENNKETTYRSLSYETVRRGGGTVQDESHLKVLSHIVYAGKPGSVRRIPFWRVFGGDVSDVIKDKIVLIGATATDLHDTQPTPISGDSMPGVEIQADIANMLLMGYRLAPIDGFLSFLWIMLAAMIPGMIFVFSERSLLPIFMNIGLGIFYLVLVAVLFELGVIAPLLHIQLAWIISTATVFGYRYFTGDKEKHEIRKLFSKYVSKDVMEELLRDPSQVRLGGEEENATIFFSDVRGFTTLSEKLTPTELVHFLNRYFTVMTNIALGHRGVVDKYIGDAIMAFWGAPLANPNHALDAILASLEMIEALHDFNKKSLESGGLAIDIGIGLNSGLVVAGNMGSDQRFDYTVMGDAVNLASRLEGQTKTYGVHIITSEFTIASVSELVLKEHGIMIREVDRVRVKGKVQPVVIYEIVERGRKEAVEKIYKEFNELRNAYYDGKWKEVIKLGKHIESLVEDGPTNVLVARAKHYIEEPPKEWHGVYELKTK